MTKNHQNRNILPRGSVEELGTTGVLGNFGPGPVILYRVRGEPLVTEVGIDKRDLITKEFQRLEDPY